MILVVYRILYGTDFLERSIRSVYDAADKIFVGYSTEPWSQPKNFPLLTDIERSPPDVVEEYFDLSEGKIKISKHQCSTPKGEFNFLYNKALDLFSLRNELPTLTIFMEPDMVWSPGVFKDFVKEAENYTHLFAPQIELWKTHKYRIRRIHDQTRLGPAAYKDIPEFRFGAYNGKEQIISKHGCYNFGFCLNEKTMYYKHRAACDFSAKIKDSIPAESWYTEKWLNWTPAIGDLEPAAKHIAHIPKADPFEMPEDMRKFMNENPVKNT